jgi:hypothetical protein
MPRLVASVAAVVLGAALAVALASCGADDAKLLAGNTAQEIRENLDSVQRLVEEGDCVGAEDEALQVSAQVEALQGIDPELKRALEEGSARLNEVVGRCEEETAEETVEETLPTTTESAAERAKQEAEKEKEQEKREKEEEKAEEEQEKEQEQEEPTLPPQSNGNAKGHQEAPVEEAEGGEPSGGIGPASEAGEGG